jgi:hypothetical protein
MVSAEVRPAHRGGRLLMTSLGLYVLSLLLAAFPPGGTPQSETREAGAKRYELVAQALADAALYQGAAWDRGPADLARAMIAAGGPGMGFRLDVQLGVKRGRHGEVCHMDLLPSTLRTLVPFEHQGLPDAELTALVVGTGYLPLRRCFDAGALLMVRTRREALRRCGSDPVDYAIFALFARYRCSTKPEQGEDVLARPRSELYWSLRARKHTSFPRWYEPPIAGKESASAS